MRDRNGIDVRSFVDFERGTVDRSIFVSADIYQMELERIFARSWNFMCHESQIPRPGDFFLNFIGEDSVIATRDRQGDLQVLLNTCRHRGNAVCRAEMGHANSFMCTYHGWTYDLAGKLIGVPGYKNYYHEDLKREEWGLVKAAKVESYKGFVFATMDPAAPSLEEYLGEVGRMGLTMVAAHGDVAIIDGVQKNRIGCNWKMAVDNVFDWYHAPLTHASSAAAGYMRRPVWSDMDHIVALGEYGHAISGPRLTREMRAALAKQPSSAGSPQMDERWRDRAEAQQELGPLGADQRGHPNIFPNLWIASSGTQLSLRLPRGPSCTEIWWFTILDKDMPAAERAVTVSRANHTFGPAGMLEQDDGENWNQSTRAAGGAIGRRYPLNFAMNLGRGTIEHEPSGLAHIDTHINEHAQLWTYRAWTEWMVAEDWAALKRHHSVPVGTM
jgi:phenylpropionate dioxygenase-like ring-hydroxylating dioxygenase large terminal subunit